MRLAAILFCAGLGLGIVAPGRAAEPARADVIGPLTVTESSRPYLGAASEVEAAGYVEEEFFLSGPAHTYEWVGRGPAVQVVAGPVRYTTRILVRRPREPARFSGVIEVNILNASGGVDAGAPAIFGMVRRGDAWIGLTSKSLTAQALKRFDAGRYAALDWPNPAPEAQRCARPSILPTFVYGPPEVFAALPAATFNSAQEDGLVWDMLAQLGRLLKGEERARVLPGFRRPLLFMTGASQSANYLHTWIAAFHGRERLADGKPLYDGYLPSVGGYLLRINQCSRDVGLQEALSKIPAPDVPVISVMSESEIRNARYTSLPDVVRARSGWVTWQVAGGSHGAGEVPGLPRKRLGMPDPAAAPQRPPSIPGVSFPPDYLPNDLAWAPVLRAAWVDLVAWARDGVKPPQAPPIRLDAQLAIVRDAHGNAQGGLRLPYVDVPVAAYRGSIGDQGLSAIIGRRTPFDAATLRRLYPTGADYVGKFNAATDTLVGQRFLSPEDGTAMKSAAARLAASWISMEKN